MKILCGGSVINGATQSSLLYGRKLTGDRKQTIMLVDPYFNSLQCCARVSPGTREPDPWEKIHQNRTRNRQKINVSSRTGTGTAECCVSVLKPEKALKNQHPPHEINDFVGGAY